MIPEVEEGEDSGNRRKVTFLLRGKKKLPKRIRACKRKSAIRKNKKPTIIRIGETSSIESQKTELLSLGWEV